jgi:hypothetical protein
MIPVRGELLAQRAAYDRREETHEALRFRSHSSHETGPAFDCRELYGVIEMHNPRTCAECDARRSLELDNAQLNASSAIVFAHERRPEPEVPVARLLHGPGARQPFWFVARIGDVVEYNLDGPQDHRVTVRLDCHAGILAARGSLLFATCATTPILGPFAIIAVGPTALLCRLRYPPMY